MDDDQQFCLRWNNHQSTLISVFDTLLENETLVDCTLAAEGKFLKAHKVVLSACSPYFAALLQEQYDKHPIFILKDVKYQELRAMMDYMYRGEVNISQDQLAALLKAAESLQIKGLSDNRSGSGSGVSKPEHHRPMGVPVGGGAGGLGGSGKPPGAYTLENTKRARVGPSSMDSQSGSREGSSSPSRRRRKARRRSIENAMADVHDNSNSSQIQAQQSSLLQQQQQQQQQQQSNANLAGVGAITAAASALASQGLPAGAMSTGSGVGGVGAGATAASLAAAVASAQGTTQQQLTTSVTKKTESVKGTSDAMITDNLQASSSSLGGVGAGDEQQEMIVAAHHGVTAVKADKQNHKQKGSAGVASKDIGGSEMVIEPKSEFDDEGNDETVEDLTLDEEDIGMDDLDQNAGTSQGAEGSSQGYAAWQHERSQDELLLGAQEAQQRDPQASAAAVAAAAAAAAAGCAPSSTSASANSNSSQTPPPPSQHSLIRDYWYELKFSDLFKFINPDGRYQCPRFNCLKSYKDASSLQRHIRYECGGQKKFRCLMCGKAFSQSSHLKRHLESGVCVKYYL